MIMVVKKKKSIEDRDIYSTRRYNPKYKMTKGNAERSASRGCTDNFRET